MLCNSRRHVQLTFYATLSKLTFPEGLVINCFVLPPKPKLEKKQRKKYCLDANWNNTFHTISSCTT